jgi:hypothetical protein
MGARSRNSSSSLRIGLGLFVGFDKLALHRMLEWILLDGLAMGGSVYMVRLTPSGISLPSARSKRSNIDGKAHSSAIWGAKPGIPRAQAVGSLTLTRRLLGAHALSERCASGITRPRLC